MTKNPRQSNGNARRKLRARLKAQGRGCWICEAFGRNPTIDYSLPAGHPGAFEVDELVPVSLGGNPLDPNNTAPVHRACNQWRGNKTVDHVMAIAQGRAPMKNGSYPSGNRQARGATSTTIGRALKYWEQPKRKKDPTSGTF